MVLYGFAIDFNAFIDTIAAYFKVWTSRAPCWVGTDPLPTLCTLLSPVKSALAALSTTIATAILEAAGLPADHLGGCDGLEKGGLGAWRRCGALAHTVLCRPWR